MEVDRIQELEQIIKIVTAQRDKYKRRVGALENANHATEGFAAYLINDNYGNIGYVDDLEAAEQEAAEWIANEEIAWKDYEVDIYKRIKSYDRRSE